MSLRTIARHTGSSVTTVYRWIRRWQQEGHINTRPRLYSSFVCDYQDMLSIKDKLYENASKSTDVKYTEQSLNKKVSDGIEELLMNKSKELLAPMLSHTGHNFPQHLQPELRQDCKFQTMFIPLYPSECHLQTTGLQMTNQHFRY